MVVSPTVTSSEKVAAHKDARKIPAILSNPIRLCNDLRSEMKKKFAALACATLCCNHGCILGEKQPQ